MHLCKLCELVCLCKLNAHLNVKINVPTYQTVSPVHFHFFLTGPYQWILCTNNDEILREHVLYICLSTSVCSSCLNALGYFDRL